MQFENVLVLGATGRIGGILRRNWPQHAARWQTRGRVQGPDWLSIDPLREPDGLAQAARGAQAILCLAGVTQYAAAAGDDLEDNTRLALAAIDAAAAASADHPPIKVLLTSSAAVYGRAEGPCRETGPVAPVTAYGQAKLRMEQAAAARARALGVPATSLRIGNIAGADAILGQWQPGFELDRFADGRTPRRSYIGPMTLARVLHALCAAQGLPDILNVAAPGVVEMGALLDAAGLGWSPRPAPAGAVAEVAFDTARLDARVSMDPALGTAAALVAEWRADQARALDPAARPGTDRPATGSPE